MSDNPFRQLPAVGLLLEHPALQALQAKHAHETILEAIRHQLDCARDLLRNDKSIGESISVDSMAQLIAEQVEAEFAPRLRTVINATGIVLHTNLGRSPMGEEAARAAYEAARGYLNLELDLQTGRRSSRQDPIRMSLTRLTGAESATVVNNCAAATVIVLRTLAAGKEVIVSRGQLIEIGGSFRIPEIMAASGAALREVGATNITRAGDYEKALGPNTALLLRVHCSNYRIRGFTETVPLDELVLLGKKHGLPVVDDAGSGALVELAAMGMSGEPVVSQSIAAGADLVLFSGDKLLGGPQAGIIAGKKALIDRIEKEPLMRAFRLDKMTLAALEATLRLYRRAEEAIQIVPTLQMLAATPENLRRRAEPLAARIGVLRGIARAEVCDDLGFAGGGSLPDQPLATVVIAVQLDAIGDDAFAERLRLGTPAVLARIQEGRVLFDLRTVFERQETELLQAIETALKP